MYFLAPEIKQFSLSFHSFTTSLLVADTKLMDARGDLTFAPSSPDEPDMRGSININIYGLSGPPYNSDLFWEHSYDGTNRKVVVSLQFHFSIMYFENTQ